MSANLSRERRQTRSTTASNNSANNSISNSSVDSASHTECPAKRKLANKEEIDTNELIQSRKSQRRSSKTLTPNENDMNTIKQITNKNSKKENKISGDNVLNSKNVNNSNQVAKQEPGTSVSSSTSSTSNSSDLTAPKNTSNTENKISTRRKSSNYLGLSSSSSLVDQSVSSPLTRKRNLSSSIDMSKNDNENDPCSQSAQASSSGLVQSASSSSLSKRLKLKHKYAFKELNENTNLQTSFRLMSKDEYDQNSPYTDREEGGLSEINEVDESNDNDGQKESLVCPVLGCKSEGHLDGVSEHHYSYDTCPIYFVMSKEECSNRHCELEKRVDAIKEKIKKINENKKCLRKQFKCKEQSEYSEKVNRDLKSLVKMPEDSNTINKKSKLNFLQNSDFLSDLKNLSTSFIINTLSNCLTPTPMPIYHHTLLKHTNNASLNFFNNLNQTIAQTPNLNDLNISKYELDLFKDILITSTKEQVTQDNRKHLKLKNKSNKIIQFGNYEVETWCKSPYPDDYWQLNKIFICQYCLIYMKSHSVLNRHLDKCLWRHPPGREIYRKDNLSFFEVDGKFNKIYCQNLCLLAKLFLDHKTLYYEVEPFLFYILTQYNEKTGSFEMIGYFSKEKQSVMNYNLSCILILPQYMNQGYGRVLIDFSYLLSRVEGKVGSPERPLSDLGLISYRSYWKSKILLYLSKHLDDQEICVKEITAESGILTNDLISTLQYIGLIKYWKGKHVILKDLELIEKCVEKKSLYSRDVDPVCLKWTPYVYQPILNESDSQDKALVKGNKVNFSTS
ncbi:unnamed protein product [Brachionus calyciflorus]|uniref:Histone acetyltransferase n=1 Tax=Brachionus calyciflorus TaxID=104777 RepID=A0A813MQP1_9BILA|nr:unnamed protein product [Brachionus calyciflorus]